MYGGESAKQLRTMSCTKGCGVVRSMRREVEEAGEEEGAGRGGGDASTAGSCSARA